MKTPNKIYVPESDNVLGEVDHNVFSEKRFSSHTSIEYLRKTMLLEWARNEIAKSARLYELYRDDYYIGRKEVMEELVDELETL